MLALVACGSSSSSGDDAAVQGASLRVTSPSFDEGGRIPTRFTCDGDEVSPALRWSGVPSGARSVAIVVDDPDAPGGTFVHWVVTGLPARSGSLAEGAAPKGQAGAWKGPCPPSGTHHYRFAVYALDRAVSAEPDAIRDAAIAAGTLTATYSRR